MYIAIKMHLPLLPMMTLPTTPPTLPTTVHMTLTLSLPPRHMGALHIVLYDKVRDVLPLCPKNVGFIVKIVRIDPRSPIVIHHTTGSLHVTVDVEVLALLPHVGNVFKARVSGLYPEGVFVTHHAMVIFCPASSMYQVQGDKLIFEDETYALDDWIDVEVVATQYAQASYQCIGTLCCTASDLNEYEVLPENNGGCNENAE
jgi:DNA-directed RNA polymerase subunit E'/Rpb7